jgi:hypothetical protein
LDVTPSCLAKVQIMMMMMMNVLIGIEVIRAWTMKKTVFWIVTPWIIAIETKPLATKFQILRHSCF